MSSNYGVPVIFHCDKAKCKVSLDTGETFALSAERVLAKEGWSTTRRGDFCPKHSRKHRKKA